MKEEELRIGNYIYLSKDDFKTKKVYQICADDFSKLDSNDCEDIKPIPLTEEWFINFGWGVDYHFDNTFIDNCSIDSLVFYYDVNNKVLILETNADCTEFNHIKYVHELQNFMFALTGKQLK